MDPNNAYDYDDRVDRRDGICFSITYNPFRFKVGHRSYSRPFLLYLHAANCINQWCELQLNPRSCGKISAVSYRRAQRYPTPTMWGSRGAGLPQLLDGLVPKDDVERNRRMIRFLSDSRV